MEKISSKATNERRQQVYFLLLKGHNAPFMCKTLNVSNVTIYNDIKFLRNKSKEYIFDMAKGSHALMYQKCIEGISLMLSECWKKFNDSKVSNKDKATFLRLGFDCQRAMFELTSEGPAVMMLSSLIERAKKLGIDYEDNNNIVIPISQEEQIANYSKYGDTDNNNNNNDMSEPTNQNGL